MKTVEVIKKNVFGRDIYYPQNEIAKQLCELLDAKGFSLANMKIIKEIGFEIKLVAEGLDI